MLYSFVVEGLISKWWFSSYEILKLYQIICYYNVILKEYLTPFYLYAIYYEYHIIHNLIS